MEKLPKVKFRKREPSEIDGFELINLAELFSKRELPKDHDPFRLHRLDFFAVLIITEGAVNHRVDFSVCTLKKGDTLIISNGQIHAFDRDSTYQGYLVLFTETFLNQHIAASCLEKINRLYNYLITKNHFHCPLYNSQFLELLHKESQFPSPLYQANIIGAILTIYLIRLADQQLGEEDKEVSANPKLLYFNEFRKWLDKDYCKTRDAKYYADKLCISYNHLNNVCKSVVKQTAKDFIDTYVIHETKRLLVATTLSAKEISFQLGFDEPTNFRKYFKRHTGYTPSKFRATLK